jgi:FMN phosphatase YigB (HAD superfamily)
LIRCLGVDYDDVLVPTSDGRPAIARIKTFLKSLRQFYILYEIFEVIARLRYKLHAGAVAFIVKARRHGVTVGIVTDRSLFSFVISARRSRFPLEELHFIHARRSFFNRFVMRFVPDGVRVFTTPYFKGHPRALAGLEEFLKMSRIPRHKARLIGDDNRDCLAATNSGIGFIFVDRHNPDFSGIWRMLLLFPRLR